ncbi:hypothetical protein BpHYR1_016102 [Brachionus plicatilis]|uniref:Uncharacterized protein n=1 Tax=Brachionus plicatilis TaxID=10195 RepID=A0A3M7QRA1_BRAPC|nr:hypothetical protein BpHYR1_016102 [Brachionus plicatilis]
MRIKEKIAHYKILILNGQNFYWPRSKIKGQLDTAVFVQVGSNHTFTLKKLFVQLKNKYLNAHSVSLITDNGTDKAMKTYLNEFVSLRYTNFIKELRVIGMVEIAESIEQSVEKITKGNENFLFDMILKKKQDIRDANRVI